jgi:hypothetical protein
LVIAAGTNIAFRRFGKAATVQNSQDCDRPIVPGRPKGALTLLTIERESGRDSQSTDRRDKLAPGYALQARG